MGDGGLGARLAALRFSRVIKEREKENLVNELVGKLFYIEGSGYTIVDVRNVDGETMIYAEPPEPVKGPGRAAFRYADLEHQLGAFAKAI